MTNRNWLLRAFIIALFGISATSQLACNTMKGVGKDTEKAGEKIQENADKAQH